MKVLYITVTNLMANSGAAVHVLGICRGLVGLDHKVTLVAETNDNKDLSELRGTDFYGINIQNLSPMKAARSVVKNALDLVKREKFDLAYIRAFPGDYLLLIRHLVRLNLPYVYEMNTILESEYKSKGQWLRGKVYGQIERRSLRRSLGWLPVTEQIGNNAAEVSRKKKPTLVAGNGVDIPELRSIIHRKLMRLKLHIPENKVVLVMSGFSKPWHGVDKLICALSHCEVIADLWLIGSTNESDNAMVKRLANDYGVIDRIRVFPWLSKQQNDDLVAAADIGIAPLALERKNLFEAQSLKVRTYLANGLPVIINHRDPKLEETLPFIRHVSLDDSTELAVAVQELISMSLNQRNEIYEFAKRRLSWDAVSWQTSTFLEALINQRNSEDDLYTNKFTVNVGRK